MRIPLAASAAAWLVLGAPNAHAITLATWLDGQNPWSDPTQWSSNPLYPCNGNGGQTFDVIISSGTPTLDLDCSIESLTLSSGGIGGTFALTVNQPFSWSGGTLHGSGTITAAGGASFSGAGIKTFNGTRSLMLAGTSQWSDGPISLGGAGATIQNTSTLTVTGAGSRELLDAGNTGSFQNSGTLTVALDSSASVVTLSPGAISSSGAIHVNTGNLALLSTGTLSGGIDGSSLRLFTGPYTLAPGGSLQVADLELAAALTVAAGASFAADSLHMINGALTLPAPLTLDNLTLGGGTISGDLQVDSLTQTGGTITGNLQVDGSFVWNGGTQSGTGTTIAQNGVTIGGATLGGSRTVVLETGTSTWTGDIDLGSGGATLRNESGSTLQVIGGTKELSDASNSGTVVNEGTIEIDLSTPTRVATLSPGTLTQNGSVHVNQGILDLFANGDHSGSIDGAGTMRIRGNPHFLPSASVTTASAEIIANLTLDAGATFEVGSLTFEAGTLGGAGDVEVSGPLTWQGGSLAGSGATIALAGAIFEDAVKVFSGSRNLSLAGGSSSVWSEGAIQIAPGASGHLINEAGSTLAVTGAARNFVGFSDGTTLLHNAGTLVFDLDDAGQALHTFTGRIENTGTLDLVAGTLDLLTSALYRQTAGITRLSGGTLSALTPLDLQGGTLEGSGVVAADVDSAAVIAPGFSAGTLTLTGDLTLLPGGTLSTELGGTAQGSGYDFVSVGGNAALAGALEASLIAGFENAIAPGDTFTVLDAATPLTGTFADVGNGQRVLLAPDYDSIAVSYGAGSAFGADKVVLHDFQPFVANDTLQVSGTAQGGTITLLVSGVEVVVNTSAGQTAQQVAEAIAAAMRAVGALSTQGIAGVASGPTVQTNGDFQPPAVVTDPGLDVTPVTSVPALPLGAVVLLAAALVVSVRRRFA